MEILTPVGRIVGGHPMTKRIIKDDKTGKPALNDDGDQKFNFYIGLAIPKTPGQDWKQTEWGAQIQAVAVADWPNGEHMQPTFAWKITDGDSIIPNKAGKLPSSKEGFPGHWIINLSTGLPIKCFHTGKFNPMDQIQDEKMIKPGDYIRVMMRVKGNNPSQSPGVYLNPQVVEVVQAGERIALETEIDAAAAFAVPPVMPAGAQVMLGQAVVHNQNAITPPPTVQMPGIVPPAITPAPDLLNVGGNQYTREQLKTAGWSDEQIAKV